MDDTHAMADDGHRWRMATLKCAAGQEPEVLVVGRLLGGGTLDMATGCYMAHVLTHGAGRRPLEVVLMGRDTVALTMALMTKGRTVHAKGTLASCSQSLALVCTSAWEMPPPTTFGARRAWEC